MKLDHIVILLSDLKQHIRFYEILLPIIGFEKVREHVFINQEDVALDFKQADDTAHEYRRHSPGFNHLGFIAPLRDSILEARNTMAKAGFKVPEIQRFEDGEAIFFKDSEGMRIELAYYFKGL